MRDLFDSSNEIDIVTLIDTLVKNGVYEKSGGEDYIRTLAETVPNSLNIKDYARIVKVGEGENVRFAVACARDAKKDQSYMLYRLGQDVLSRVIFPLGEFCDKEEIRDIAREKSLKNAEKKALPISFLCSANSFIIMTYYCVLFSFTVLAAVFSYKLFGAPALAAENVFTSLIFYSAIFFATFFKKIENN